MEPTLRGKREAVRGAGRGRTGVGGQRLRIAYVTDMVDGGLGGGMITAKNFVEALRAEHDVTVVTTGPGGADRISVPALSFPVHAMRATGFRFGVPRKRLLQEAFRNADVVHLHFPFWLSFAALREAKAMGLPIVAASHIQPENIFYQVNWRSPWLMEGLYQFWIKNLFNKVDHVVCPSLLGVQCLTTRGMVTRAHVISNGTPPDIRRTHAQRPRKEHFDLLMVGRLAAEKRQDLVLEAVRRSRHRDRIRFTLAGGGPLEAELRASVADMPNVVFLGHVDHHVLENLYNASDLFVHASDIEIEGMVVLEAMTCGLPIVVSNSPLSAASQFALGPAHLFESGSADDLARKIDYFIEHPSELDALRDKHEEASRAYSFDSCVRKLVDVYQLAVSERRAAVALHAT